MPRQGCGQAQVYKDALMIDTDAVEQRREPNKRRNTEIDASTKADPPKSQQQDEDSIIPFLKKMLEEKDEQMKGMRKTIDMLNARLEQMQLTLDRMERLQQSTEQENL